MRRALVTGGAGFIGSALADRLAADGVDVVVYDNLSSGRLEFANDLLERPNATLVEGDVLDRKTLASAMEGCDIVFHLAANADVRFGLQHPELDIEQNLLATSGLLEVMRSKGVNRIVFASSGSVYGEPELFPTPEDCPFPIQTSLYGASKVAAEGLIESYSHGYGFTGSIFRFVSILGERYSHGHVFDFYRSLKNDPSRITVLGNGKQRKSYLYVGDCVAGILAGLEATAEGTCEVFNLGSDETTIVDESVERIARYLDVTPKVDYTGGERGWPGDSPLILLDCSKLRRTGWAPQLSIEAAITRTLDWFGANPWVFDRAET